MRILYKQIVVLAFIASAVCGMISVAIAQDTVNVPSLWDPKSRLERPEPGSVKAIRFLTTPDFPPFQC